MMLTTINFGKTCLHNETIADDSSESLGVHEHSFLIQRKSYFIIPFFGLRSSLDLWQTPDNLNSRNTLVDAINPYCSGNCMKVTFVGTRTSPSS
jgi:hypothetical protein